MATDKKEHSHAGKLTSSLATIVAILSDVFTLVRDLFLGAVIIVFSIVALQHRATIVDLLGHAAGQLKGAKIDTVTIAGVELKLNENAQKIESASDSLEKTQSSLQALLPTVKDDAVRKQLSDILATLSVATTTTHDAEKILQSAVQTTTDAAKSSGGGPTSVAGGQWVVAVSADKQADQAEFEITQLKKLGYESATIYDRKGWLRSVVPFKSQDDANDALATIRQKRRNTAYIANMSQWCPHPQQVAGKKYEVCDASDASTD